jgi:hypothetical protein
MMAVKKKKLLEFDLYQKLPTEETVAVDSFLWIACCAAHSHIALAVSATPKPTQHCWPRSLMPVPVGAPRGLSATLHNPAVVRNHRPPIFSTKFSVVTTRAPTRPRQTTTRRCVRGKRVVFDAFSSVPIKHPPKVSLGADGNDIDSDSDDYGRCGRCARSSARERCAGGECVARGI